MKQGTGNSRMGATKVEPKARAVSPGAVSDLGVHQIRTRSEPLYSGRGYEAPMNKSKSHHCGTQGKH